MKSGEAISAEVVLERVHREGLGRAIQALRKPPLPSAVLQALVERPEAEGRAFVASYPLSPGYLLENLAERYPEPNLLVRLAANPRTPPHVLAGLAAHPSEEVRAQAARHPQTPARELLALAVDASPITRRALAKNPVLRLPQQARLAADADPSVRFALAESPVLAAPVALVLGIDESAVVRLHTVASSCAEDETLIGWAASEEMDVQLALLRRSKLPAAAGRLLLQSEHALVRRAARARFEPDEADLLHAATAGEPDERAWVAARPRLPRTLQGLLALDPEPEVRAALAANPDLAPEVAAYFVDVGDEPACRALAANPSVSNELIQGLAATLRPSVLAALAYRASLDPALTTLLVSRSPVFRRHWAAQGRSVSGLDVETARSLAADRLPAVRVLAVTGHAWRRADLYDFARDPSPRVRLAAVRHANAPDELLQDLGSDADAEVAEEARQILTRRMEERRKAVLSTLAPGPDQEFTQIGSPQRIVAGSLPSIAAATPPESDSGLMAKLRRLFR